MTNYEKYKSRIIDILASGDSIALKDGIPYECDSMRCEECDRDGIECNGDILMNWLLADDGTPSAERIAGNEEAWGLAQKIIKSGDNGGFSIKEINDIFDTVLQWIPIENYTYAEAAEKVKAWKDRKVFKVGDVIQYIGNWVQGVVIKVCDDRVHGITDKAEMFMWKKEDVIKTGRTLPVSDWLRQIGGEE